MYKVIINQSPPRSVWMLRCHTMVSVVTTTPSWFFHLTRGMRELRTISLIYQPRLHCCKRQHGRTFHVKAAANTSGGVVVGFFGGYTDVFPKACDSFEKLKGAQSLQCVEWGMEKGAYRVGKWGHEGQKELSLYSEFIVGSHHWITWPGSNIWQCDNTLEKIAASGDFWRIYVL